MQSCDHWDLTYHSKVYSQTREVVLKQIASSEGSLSQLLWLYLIVVGRAASGNEMQAGIIRSHCKTSFDLTMFSLSSNLKPNLDSLLLTFNDAVFILKNMMPILSLMCIIEHKILCLITLLGSAGIIPKSKQFLYFKCLPLYIWV